MASTPDPIDEHAIRGLIDRYADAVNRRDARAWAALWTGDARWAVFGQVIEGREAVVATWSGVMQSMRLVFHAVHGGVVDLAGDAATARFTISEQLQTAAGEPALLLGLYHDRFRREQGEWRIAERRLQVLYQGAPDLRGAPAASSSEAPKEPA